MGNTLCIYHGNCADGFAAAWCVRKWFIERLQDDDLEFFAGTYQQEPPDVKGKRVIIVDFSYKRPVMEKICMDAISVLVLDHHASAMRDLEGLENHMQLLKRDVIVNFDMGHSGAMLAWNYFHMDKEPPMLLRHVEDRDLYKFLLFGTKEVQAALFSYPYDFDVWDGLMLQATSVLYEEGIAILRKHDKDIKELLAVAQGWISIDGHTVPCANLPYIHSTEAGHAMSYGRKDFAACWMQTKNGIVFSLRSAEDGMDVSAIAVKFGGGGHAHAAGFTVPRNSPLFGTRIVWLDLVLGEDKGEKFSDKKQSEPSTT